MGVEVLERKFGRSVARSFPRKRGRGVAEDPPQFALGICVMGRASIQKKTVGSHIWCLFARLRPWPQPRPLFSSPAGFVCAARDAANGRPQEALFLVRSSWGRRHLNCWMRPWIGAVNFAGRRLVTYALDPGEPSRTTRALAALGRICILRRDAGPRMAGALDGERERAADRSNMELRRDILEESPFDVSRIPSRHGHVGRGSIAIQGFAVARASLPIQGRSALVFLV